jgi:raffinose/stachyose/melibiose transport system permease protein
MMPNDAVSPSLPKSRMQPAAGQAARRMRWSPGRILAYTAVIVLALIYIVPLLVMINTSLRPAREFMVDPAAIAREITFTNYTEAWEAAEFATYILNTILYTVVSTAIYLVLVTFVAFPLARNYLRGSRILYLLYVIALFLPNNLIPQFQLMLGLGLYNTQFGYILLTLTGGLGVLILYSYIQSLPTALDEAAAMDGCGYFQYVIRIVIPLIKPALATVALLQAIAIWNDLILPMIYLTSRAYYPVTRGLMVFYGQFGTAWTQLAAATIMMVAPLIVLFIFLQRYIIEGALRGSIKG